MPQRAAFFDSLQQAIDASDQTGATLGLLLVRIRRLRETNRLLGYETGEAFVDAVQAAIGSALRQGDCTWRIGEGEFAVVLPGLRDRNHAALAAAKLLRVLSAPLQAAGRPVLPVVSIGIATAPGDARTARALCRDADEACEHANAGSERYAFYSAPKRVFDFDHADLGEALAGNRLLLYLQPILDLHSGRIDRCEALSRWQHDTLGAIPPDAFVRLAEQTGQIAELTRWSFNVALRHVAEAAAPGGVAPFAVSVNVAVDALRQPGFLEQVTDVLGFWNVPPSRLMLEITESGLMTDPAYCARVLAQLREAGIGVAIDDFGTGYSSMAYLRRLPASELKIDQSFVRDMRDDPRAQKLVASMIDVSHHLGMTTVAEGVEDAETLDMLRAMGCDHAQGYHIGYPAPAAGVALRLARAVATAVTAAG